MKLTLDLNVMNGILFPSAISHPVKEFSIANLPIESNIVMQFEASYVNPRMQLRRLFLFYMGDIPLVSH